MTKLEMLEPAWLTAPKSSPPPVRVLEAPSTAALSRDLYVAVGQDWKWVDRLGWPDTAWRQWLNERRVRTWLAEHDQQTAGYFQLACSDEDIEIAYLGLLPEFLGRGWGGWLLTWAAQSAWDIGTARVWLHTCTLDHPNALANYRARGFRVFDRRNEERSPSAENM